VPLRYAVFVAC